MQAGEMQVRIQSNREGRMKKNEMQRKIIREGWKLSTSADVEAKSVGMVITPYFQFVLGSTPKLAQTVCFLFLTPFCLWLPFGVFFF